MNRKPFERVEEDCCQVIPLSECTDDVGYGREDLEITRDQWERVSNGEVLTFGVMGEYSAYLRLKPEEVKSPWRPIETAPKDDTEILILFDSATVPIVRLCWWSEARDLYVGDIVSEEVGWWSYQNSVTQEMIDTEILKPTHWMPLPEPPKES